MRRWLILPVFALVLMPVLMSRAPAATTIEEQREKLVAAKANAVEAAKRATELDAEAAKAKDVADKTAKQLAAVAGRIQSTEADIAAAEARLNLAKSLQQRQQTQLAARQGPIVRLMAAFQAMRGRPAILSLVQPGSTDDLVHVRAVLATVTPAIEQRTKGLRAELDRSRALRATIDREVATLAQTRAKLEPQRQELAQLEAQQRTTQRGYRDQALAESDRAIALGEQAYDITNLMARMGEQSVIRDRLANLPGPILRPAQPGDAPNAVADAAASQNASPAYRLPVIGEIVTGMGEIAPSGARSKGLTIATASNALVVAPAAGRVVYAGPYRGYGNVVILDHGGGWTTLITSLSALSVEVGDVVSANAPLGRAGANNPTVTIELRRGETVIDILTMVS